MDQLDALGPVGSFADDLEVSVALEDETDEEAEVGIVVDDEDAHLFVTHDPLAPVLTMTVIVNIG